MGSLDFGKFFDRATGGEGQKEIDRLRADPVRLGLAIGTGGASELVYAGIDQGKQLERNLKNNAPQLESTPTAPSENDPGISLARSEEEARSRRGRANNILGGGAADTVFGASSLLSGGGGSIARRTLSGF